MTARHLALCLSAAILTTIASAGALPRHSRVPVWFDQPDDHLKYDADLIVQDMNLVDEADVAPWREFVRARHAEGRLVYAELRPLTHAGEMLTYTMDPGGLQGAACVDLDGRPIPIPWMTGHGWHGKTPPFYCSNHPAYRAFLRQQIFLFVEAGADGIMVDDSGGSFFAADRGGCFCAYCMKGFRQYLRAKYPAERLRAGGIADPDSFDYRAFVLGRIRDRAAYRADQRQVPWNGEFRDFLRQSDVALFASLRDMAARLAGRHIPIGWDNVDFGGSRAPYYPLWDIFYSEINYQNFAVRGRGPDEVLPPGLVVMDKLAAALGKWCTPTPAPRAWQAIMEKNLTGLLQQWIALSYANGGALRYPRKGWIFSAETPWYYPPQEAFEPLYRFVRTHRDLLDGYEAVGQVGVLFTQGSGAMGSPYYTPLKHVCAGLVTANVPFGFAVAGDELLGNRLAGDEADRFELMLVPEPIRLVDGQHEIVERWKREGRAVAVTAETDIAALVRARLRPWVAVEGDDSIWLFPRRGKAAGAPIVCHLVGSDYDAVANRIRARKNVTVRLDRALLAGRRAGRITYHHGGDRPLELPATMAGDSIRVTVPEVGVWGIVEIETLGSAP